MRTRSCVLSDGKLVEHGRKEDVLPKLAGTMSAVKRCGKEEILEGGEESC